jgi:diadenosine tetraphosphate (Ap4A) HIT family hydrolase
MVLRLAVVINNGGDGNNGVASFLHGHLIAHTLGDETFG